MKTLRKLSVVVSLCLVLQLTVASFTRPIYARDIRSASPHPGGSVATNWIGSVAYGYLAVGLGYAFGTSSLTNSGYAALRGLSGPPRVVRPSMPKALD